MIEDQASPPRLFPGHPSNPQTIHKRHVLTLKERVAVLKYLDSHPKATTTEVCHIFASNPRTIRRIQDKRETLLNLPDGDKRLSRTRFTKGTCLPVEACVLKWMDLAHLSKCNITNLTLQNRAKFFFAMLKSYLPNLPFLAASNGWINRFKVRNSINLKGLMSDSETFFSQELMPVREKIQFSLGSYLPHNIFSLSLSMLYFSFIPTPKYPFPRGSDSHTPPPERISLVLCSNSDASEKLPVGIIRSASSLPLEKDMQVFSLESTTGRLEPESISSWLTKFQEHIGSERQVALVIDSLFSNYFVSEDIRTLHSNMEFIFLPQRHSSHLQAFNLGINDHFKAHYRAGLVQQVLDSTDLPLEESFSFVSPNERRMFQLIQSSWLKVPNSVVQLAWDLTGLVPHFKPVFNPGPVELFDPFRALANSHPGIYALIGGYGLADQICLENDGKFPTEAELLIVEEAVAWYLYHREEFSTKKDISPSAVLVQEARISLNAQYNNVQGSEFTLDTTSFFQTMKPNCLDGQPVQAISLACNIPTQTFDQCTDMLPAFGAAPFGPSFDQIQNVDMLLQLLRNQLSADFGAPADVTSALDYISHFVHQFDYQ